MKILAIETSCDETALSLVEGSFDDAKNVPPVFSIINNSLFSQTKIHEPYGGVFPNLAKREHARNLVPLLKQLLGGVTKDLEKNNAHDSTPENNTLGVKAPNDVAQSSNTPFTEDQCSYLKNLFAREPDLFDAFITHIPTIKKPKVDGIAVTYGPGLEPALWVGINFAKALHFVWNIPVIPINHMEGHIVSVLTTTKEPVSFPAIALLISGGHTELVHISTWTEYKIVGETRDDAVGEAFDKVARMLSLPYPGGPHISALAEKERTHIPQHTALDISLPRPMINSKDLDFSFSGLKTAVLYKVKNIPILTEVIKQCIAYEFENAVAEVLVHKTKKALMEYGAKSLIIAGGVIANTHIRRSFTALEKELPEIKLYMPEMQLATDNAIMIAIAALVETHHDETALKINPDLIRAQGNLRL